MRDCPYGICCPRVYGGWDLDALGHSFAAVAHPRVRVPRRLRVLRRLRVAQFPIESDICSMNSPWNFHSKCSQYMSSPGVNHDFLIAQLQIISCIGKNSFESFEHFALGRALRSCCGCSRIVARNLHKQYYENENEVICFIYLKLN